MTNQIETRLLGPADTELLTRVNPDVFDHEVSARWSAEFLADSRHHLAVAIADEIVVGMASAVHYVHPDKGPELWINEVGVAASHQRLGLARQLINLLFQRARELGCTEAWVLTDTDNIAARALYASMGGQESQTVSITFPLIDGQ